MAADSGRADGRSGGRADPNLSMVGAIRAVGRSGGPKKSSRIPNLSSLPSRAIQPTGAKAMAAFGGHCLRARAVGRTGRLSWLLTLAA